MLKPIMPGTDRPKTFDEMNATESADFARQCYEAQFHNLRTGWPVDETAVKRADSIAESVGDRDLLTARDSFRGFRVAKQGDLLVLNEKLAESQREVARLRKGH